MNKQINIDKRFCGLPISVHGGYLSGILAGYFNGAVEVTFRNLAPLEQNLEVDFNDHNRIRLLHGDQVIAEAQTIEFKLDVPQPPSYLEAVEASKKYLELDHSSNTCFGCGPKRAEGDGLRIFPGPISGQNMVAAPWVPDASFADEAGHIKPEIIWASLDCSGLYALRLKGNSLTSGLKLILTGKFAVNIENHVSPGEKYIVIAWPISIEGRKLYSGTALFSESGNLCASAKTTWIELK
jgi:hypothetical protein